MDVRHFSILWFVTIRVKEGYYSNEWLVKGTLIPILAGISFELC
jgi:hypothetical protein